MVKYGGIKMINSIGDWVIYNLVDICMVLVGFVAIVVYKMQKKMIIKMRQY